MRWVPLVSVATLLVACAATKPPEPQPPSNEAPTNLADAGDDAAPSSGPASADADAGPDDVAEEETGPCPKNMVLVATNELRFCVDVYEASLLESDGSGAEKPYPHWLPVDGHTVRAVSAPDVFPQAYISELQADDACVASGKRLCGYGEWKTACMGPEKTTFPYGDTRQSGACHDTGKSAVGAVFGMRALEPAPAPPPSKKGAASKKATTTKKNRPVTPTTKGRAASTTQPRATRLPPGVKLPPAKRPASPARPARPSARPASVEPSVWAQLNDPRLGQVDGALAKTGSHLQCVNGYGALDMVGNLHEWVKTDPNAPHGSFAGGYYLDTSINGDGCNYRTGAHAHDYHDYSTGFRCCVDAR